MDRESPSGFMSTMWLLGKTVDHKHLTSAFPCHTYETLQRDWIDTATFGSVAKQQEVVCERFFFFSFLLLIVTETPNVRSLLVVHIWKKCHFSAFLLRLPHSRFMRKPCGSSSCGLETELHLHLPRSHAVTEFCMELCECTVRSLDCTALWTIFNTRLRSIQKNVFFHSPDSSSKHVIVFENMEEKLVTIGFV